MSLSDDFSMIMDAIKERSSLKNTVKAIVKRNDDTRKKEQSINSSIYALMNIFNSVQNKATNSNIDLDGMTIRTTQSNKILKNTAKDPEVIMKAASLNDQFNRMFEITKRKNSNGTIDYIIKKKKLEI